MLHQKIDNGLDAALDPAGTGVTALRYRQALAQARQGQQSCSAVSQIMFRPDSLDLFIRREFTPCCLRTGFGERCLLFRRQLDDWLILTSDHQDDAGDVVLHFRRQGPRSLNRLLKKVCHRPIMQVIVHKKAKTLVLGCGFQALQLPVHESVE